MDLLKLKSQKNEKRKNETETEITGNHWKGTPFSTSRMASYYTTLFYYTLMVSSGWLLFKAFFLKSQGTMCAKKSSF